MVLVVRSTPQNPSNGNDGDHGTTTSRNSGVFIGAPSANYWWFCDFGVHTYITVMDVDGHLVVVGQIRSPTTAFVECSDDVVVDDFRAHVRHVPGRFGLRVPVHHSGQSLRIHPRHPSAHRYWRIRRKVATGGFVNGDSFGEMHIYGDIIPEWTLGPNIHDEDNATYHEVAAGPDVMRVELTDPLLVYEAIVRMSFNTTTERTYSFYGGNEADYSDLVLLDSVTFAPIGSFTAQNITFDWIASTPYQYFFLEGPNERRRVHELTLHATPRPDHHQPPAADQP